MLALVAAFGLVRAVNMTATSSTAVAPQPEGPVTTPDDIATICGISVVAGILTNVLHEGVGHGLIALLTGAKSGLLTTVAWSSEFDSRPVEAGGTLVNLAAGIILWLILRSTKTATASTRYFLTISCAFNLFTATGYFFFSGVTNFGDWAMVISGLHPHWLWQGMLVVGGASSYYAAVLLVATALVRYLGVPRDQHRRLRRLTVVPYFTAILVASLAGVLNPLGMQLIFESALPATAGGQSGLLWLQYYIPREIPPGRTAENLGRSYVWIVVATVLGLLYVVVLGRGITIHL